MKLSTNAISERLSLAAMDGSNGYLGLNVGGGCCCSSSCATVVAFYTGIGVGFLTVCLCLVATCLCYKKHKKDSERQEGQDSALPSGSTTPEGGAITDIGAMMLTTAMPRNRTLPGEPEGSDTRHSDSHDDGEDSGEAYSGDATLRV